MSENIKTIIVNNLIDKWKENPHFFNGLPEFNFIPPLASKIKEKGCTCGLGGEIRKVTQAFNTVVSHLNEEQVGRMKGLFGVEKLCFGLQSDTGFDVKCY